MNKLNNRLFISALTLLLSFNFSFAQEHEDLIVKNGDTLKCTILMVTRNFAIVYKDETGKKIKAQFMKDSIASYRWVLWNERIFNDERFFELQSSGRVKYYTEESLDGDFLHKYVSLDGGEIHFVDKEYFDKTLAPYFSACKEFLQHYEKDKLKYSNLNMHEIVTTFNQYCK